MTAWNAFWAVAGLIFGSLLFQVFLHPSCHLVDR